MFKGQRVPFLLSRYFVDHADNSVIRDSTPKQCGGYGVWCFADQTNNHFSLPVQRLKTDLFHQENSGRSSELFFFLFFSPDESDCCYSYTFCAVVRYTINNIVMYLPGRGGGTPNQRMNLRMSE